MGNVWVIAAVWIGLALVATLLAIWFRISTALTEIVVGTLAQLIIGTWIGTNALGAKTEWITFLAGTGAVILTFLAGAELNPAVFRAKWKEARFFRPVSRLHRGGAFSPGLGSTSELAGRPATEVVDRATVYAVMLELGFNVTEFGKAILAACFINDLGTVIALGLIFSPFTVRTIIFIVGSVVAFVALPFITPRFFRKYGGRVSELEAKYILLLLFGMGALAVWAGSEAVLPAYVIGMLLAGTVGKDHTLIKRLRTLTFGLLTPFYFIRAGSFVSVPALISAPLIFVTLFFAKSFSKFAGLFPAVKAFKYQKDEGLYYTLMMSTGLTFGTISSLFGLNHGVIDQAQYSHLVATVIGSAVIPTMIANAFFMPRHLLPRQELEVEAQTTMQALTDGDIQ